MKFPAVAVMLAASAILTIALLPTIVQWAPANSPLFSKNPGLSSCRPWAFSPTNEAPLFDPDFVFHPSQSAKMLGPGVYEARPFVLTVIIPPPTGDHCNLAKPHAKIPAQNPGVTLLPKFPARK
ncbi:MAG TPA: hypothetical protein VMH30_13885 [Verrucomicrobiae bacterium]|nr:hypothetical protein [Verrucomicrobiae bacterium]